MLNPDSPQLRVPHGSQSNDPLAVDGSAFDEQLATQKILHVWSLPKGRFPLVTLLVVIASVVATGLSFLLPDLTYRLLYASGGEIWLSHKAWGLLGCVFLHGGLLHLVFNCYWIWLFGRLLERDLGCIRYLCLFFGTAVFGSIAELAWSGQPGIGLSGVAYAFFGFLLVNRSRHPDFRRVLFGNTRLLLGGWFVACFVLTYTGVLNIANFAHLGGLVAGCVAGVALYSGAWQKRARAASVVLGLAALSIVFWAPWHEAWQMAHAYRALKAGDKDAALVAFENIRAKNPVNTWALSQEALLREERGEYALTRDILVQLVTHQPDALILNNLAWLLATCSVPDVRDGAKAVEYALRACTMDEWKTAGYIDTLAAAHAEGGNFSEAEKWMLKAMESPGANTTAYQAHLDSFRVQKPWRE